MIRILSLNVIGLNSNYKRYLALWVFRQSEADIIFVQETYLVKRGLLAFATKHNYTTTFFKLPRGKGQKWPSLLKKALCSLSYTPIWTHRATTSFLKANGNPLILHYAISTPLMLIKMPFSFGSTATSSA